MSYKQLIEGQRYQILAYISYRAIAKRLRLSHSTISREVRRNQSISQGYLPEKAYARALNRRHCSVKSRLCELTVTLVELGLSNKWSPEQISGVRKARYRRDS
ncbi:helix-turn-helix domain-containing protein [Neptunomonas concharum]|uniref:Helix-turn-helix domain-containing protein n=1 Tax=Neptunomonas concharum TaxID=1031538 RepID=A0A5P1RCB2_9GAMM|nr:helix-turn-helix domain-containing protein [Neptunomonas concharum]